MMLADSRIVNFGASSQWQSRPNTAAATLAADAAACANVQTDRNSIARFDVVLVELLRCRKKKGIVCFVFVIVVIVSFTQCHFCWLQIFCISVALVVKDMLLGTRKKFNLLIP